MGGEREEENMKVVSLLDKMDMEEEEEGGGQWKTEIERGRGWKLTFDGQGEFWNRGERCEEKR